MHLRWQKCGHSFLQGSTIALCCLGSCAVAVRCGEETKDFDRTKAAEVKVGAQSLAKETNVISQGVGFRGFWQYW